MKLNFRAGLIAAVIYTVIAAVPIYQAFFGRVPNDAGMIVAISAHPTYFLLMPYYEAFRGTLAAWLQLPVNDRFAMEFDAITGWLIGCLQYGAPFSIIFIKRQAAQQGVPADDSVNAARRRSRS